MPKILHKNTQRTEDNQTKNPNFRQGLNLNIAH